MNIKEKMIEAIDELILACMAGDIDLEELAGRMADDVLAVLADPENWTPDIEKVSWNAAAGEEGGDIERVTFAAVITHIKGLPT